MKIFVIKTNEPYETLAYENIIMNDKDITGDVLVLYQHRKSIIIGNNQNAFEEINREYVKENDILVQRRKSGGGAVYHDIDNLNFSFISDKSSNNSYQKFLRPILNFLTSLGLQTEFHGRNDILANGCKISGNAQYISGDRIVSHGTLLFDVDMTNLAKALNPNKIKFESKGIKSVRARVANINDLLENKMTVDEFRNALVDYFVKNENSTLEEIPYAKYEKQFKEVSELFKSDKWNYDRAANFTYSNVEKFPGGLIKVYGEIKDARIVNLIFTGDFLSKKDVREIEPLFKSVRYNEESILEILDKIDIESYFGTITKEELIKIILG
ncbi:lipoate--protein ligase [Mycoplasma tauri]|uniref:lipoate--protein ligase n=1 Tax=Mycoplasma tauri TaxID=547987 RepID=A0A953NEK7_9MOLU|nr:lipoate--protein ligase [Mycoplasma tauri]MBZ4195513.1 lipoate--protein ligase [Mycoplasma tauri]MBZ4204320.1 lipoate--protein ligase [Mycoplasma tauri]MBZ4218368.1 lipoate--protein ligase [Mycoplasma tauri]MBZ4226586.1 lipoate--protein ligase [Mycoplasma tauri]QSB07585.1 lipoate--protein ligase [Mycoplasma tauri]